MRALNRIADAMVSRLVPKATAEAACRLNHVWCEPCWSRMHTCCYIYDGCPDKCWDEHC